MHRYALAVVLCLTAAGVIAIGSASAQTAAKPKPPQIVTVKKVDNSTVRGVIERSDGRQVTIKPTKGNAFGDPVEIAWPEIKTVSNGLTRQKARHTWKLEHKSEVCEACKGDGRAACETCKGIGHDPAASADCKTCAGELLVDCPDKRCADGKVPCPEPCLKASDPGWSKPDENGKRWRSFSMSGGTARISDGHLGEILRRGKRGEAAQPVACETCNKTGMVVCPTCGGDHKAPCPTCKAKKTAPDCADCDAGLAPCKACDESGMKGVASAEPAPEPAPAAPEPATKPPADNNDGF